MLAVSSSLETIEPLLSRVSSLSKLEICFHNPSSNTQSPHKHVDNELGFGMIIFIDRLLRYSTTNSDIIDYK